MTYDVGNLSICIFAISISSLVRLLFRSLALTFFNGVAFFLMVSVLKVFCVIWMSSSDMFFATIFSQSVTCLRILFILLSFKHRAKKWWLSPCQVWHFCISLLSRIMRKEDRQVGCRANRRREWMLIFSPINQFALKLNR